MRSTESATPLPLPPPPPKPAAEPRPAVQVAKMLGYFAVLTVALRVFDQVIAAVAHSSSLGNLMRVGKLIETILDVDKNLDELIVTGFALVAALVLIVPVSWVLKVTRGDEREPSLTQTLIVLCMVVAGVTVLIQDSLARSFGLVGVVAAVRYRNTLKDSKDAVYVFLALVIGMASGLHAYPVGALLSFLACGVLLALWVVQTRAAPGEASLIERLKVAEKRGDRTPEQALAWLTPQARQRLEEELMAQSRYITMASVVARKNGRKPNAAITVQMTGEPGARDRVNAVMLGHGGDWQLLGAEEANGVTTLEYLGRVPRRKSPPVKFIERLQHADASVLHVTFRSLRKMVADKLDVGEAPHPAEAKPAEPAEKAAA